MIVYDYFWILVSKLYRFRVKYHSIPKFQLKHQIPFMGFRHIANTTTDKLVYIVWLIN